MTMINQLSGMTGTTDRNINGAVRRLTARNAFDEAVRLLGYCDESGATDESSLLPRMLAVVNTVYADLFYLLGGTDFAPVQNGSQLLNLPERALNDCLVYGVAMWLAQSEGDSEMQRIFASLYEYRRERLSLRSSSTVIEDVLPRGGWL